MIAEHIGLIVREELCLRDTLFSGPKLMHEEASWCLVERC